MIEIPWQLEVAALAFVAVIRFLNHLQSADFDELVRAEKNQQHRDTMNSYRDAYKNGWKHGSEDQRQCEKRGES